MSTTVSSVVFSNGFGDSNSWYCGSSVHTIHISGSSY